MSSYKEQWFREYERLCDKAQAEGRKPDEGCVLADEARQNIIDRIYDHADMLRKRAKEEGF